MDTTDQAVELYYSAARRDVREVLRWRAVRAPGGRVQLLVWLVLVPLAPLTLIVVQHGRGTDPAGLAFAAGVGVVLGAACLCLDLWRLARRMYRWASKHPEYRCVIAEREVRNHRPDGTAAVYAWARYTGWTETRNLFVFVHGNGDLAWLPKRAALVPADLDRLRAILGRNLRRL
ncbi:YcxB family protein [Streptomyces sp. NBC_01264]|uniref:YcxB family protein n=1 Tax=Streptomyces sp. NBC_01264 TaxID=2903804 RepID=UPI00225B763B|nr:YcxB family protein [Streptomyces sp. NBC_01264]MCX4778304.1 YcxB family protein [Streptomyces sp. NBC_01264]